MEKNMNENFKKLNNRVVDSLNDTDLEKLNYLLSKIKDPTLVSRDLRHEMVTKRHTFVTNS